MNTAPKLIAFDLDDTLAPSKAPIDEEIKQLLTQLLNTHEVCIISGGTYTQFQHQVVGALRQAGPERLTKLHLMPTCGTQYFRYDGETWQQHYAETLVPSQRDAACAAIERSAKELGYWETQTWGPIIEDRGSQITFSALGQHAPIDAKHAWDPDNHKKTQLRDRIQALLPDLEVRSGGTTSIDITRKGIDKAYGMRKLEEHSGIALSDMLFIGDRLDPNGNDYPVKAMGVACHAVTGWQDTAAFLRNYLQTGS